jgi:hypothetical protein
MRRRTPHIQAPASSPQPTQSHTQTVEQIPSQPYRRLPCTGTYQAGRAPFAGRTRASLCQRSGSANSQTPNMCLHMRSIFLLMRSFPCRRVSDAYAQGLQRPKRVHALPQGLGNAQLCACAGCFDISKTHQESAGEARTWFTAGCFCSAA